MLDLCCLLDVAQLERKLSSARFAEGGCNCFARREMDRIIGSAPGSSSRQHHASLHLCQHVSLRTQSRSQQHEFKSDLIHRLGHIFVDSKKCTPLGLHKEAEEGILLQTWIADDRDMIFHA